MMNLVSLNASTPRTSPLTLLYAPTWNPGLSSAEIFSKRLIECLRGPHETWSILIKPHPHSFKESPEWIKLWRELSQTHPHVALIDEEQDLACYIPKADMMISDTSSAPFLFLSVNRPILLLQNPQALNDPQTYDPQGIEWQWKEMTYEVFQPEEVYPTIEHILSQGDPKYALRKEY
jgi:CDP-glycerol glycerophosphotransferase (TagB/SpsB family)